MIGCSSKRGEVKLCFFCQVACNLFLAGCNMVQSCSIHFHFLPFSLFFLLFTIFHTPIQGLISIMPHILVLCNSLSEIISLISEIISLISFTQYQISQHQSTYFLLFGVSFSSFKFDKAGWVNILISHHLSYKWWHNISRVESQSHELSVYSESQLD